MIGIEKFLTLMLLMIIEMKKKEIQARQGKNFLFSFGDVSHFILFL